jgi:hypothetical protein
MAAMDLASPHRVVDGKYKRLRPYLHDADAPSQMTTTAAHRKLDNFAPNLQTDPISRNYSGACVVLQPEENEVSQSQN